MRRSNNYDFQCSNIRFINHYPKHWSLSKFSRHYVIRMGETIPETELEPSGKLPVYSATESGKILGFSNLRKPLVFKGDLIIPARGNSIGAVKLVVRPSSCTQTTIAAKLIDHKGIIPKYAFYFARAFRNDLFYFDNTAIPQITTEYVSQNPLLIPPSIEQQKIAQFLDYETAKIDALIDEQKRLIELLKEKRQAVISHAVTKGLSPDAPMKDSGVGWLGEVPEHWKLTKLGYLGNAIIGLTYSPDDIIDEGGAIVLRSTNIQNGRVSLHDNVHVSKKISDKLRLRVGDILICSRNGSRALIGKNALIDESAAGHTFGAFTTVFRSTYNPFLRYIFDSRIFSAQAGGVFQDS